MYTEFENLLNKYFGKKMAIGIKAKITGSDLIDFNNNAEKYAEQQVEHIKAQYKENYFLEQVILKIKGE